VRDHVEDVHRLKQEAIMDWMIYGANGYTGDRQNLAH
jgi:hypothetical protein